MTLEQPRLVTKRLPQHGIRPKRRLVGFGIVRRADRPKPLIARVRRRKLFPPLLAILEASLYVGIRREKLAPRRYAVLRVHHRRNLVLRQK